MSPELNSDGSILTLCFTSSEVAAINSANEEGTLTDNELLEHWLCNSEFIQLNPTCCGDLTDAPLFGIVDHEAVHTPLAQDMVAQGRALGYTESHTCDVATWVLPVLARWGWMNYAVKSMVQQVLENGRVRLDGHVVPHELHALYTLYGASTV